MTAHGIDKGAPTPTRERVGLATTTPDAGHVTDGVELPAGAAVERYIVLKKLGQGGMGVVYLAIDPGLDRRVAIKVVQAGPAGSDAPSREARARLLREAQAMAKLSHPNVATVFDVGALGDEMFIAMEYVPGLTLRAWLEGARRSPREIVAVFAQAGRGLAAAHASGVLHRDFKPDNVMLDAEHRPRVLDFGLARLVGTVDIAAVHPADNPLTSPSGVIAASAFDLAITRTGALVGTPAYMPPELMNGQEIDARGDQFSFCVALWEALYGERPFRADNVVELVKTVTRGVVSEPKGRRGVPRGVHRVLLRGLSVRVDDRYPEMTELLGALESASAAPRRRMVAAATVLAAAGALVLGWGARSERTPVCAAADQEISEAWGEPQRAAIAAAFHASGNPRGDATWARARAPLDAYAAGWTTMRRESCEATRVRGAQSDEALDLRTACLDQRRRELKATVTLLSTASAALVDDAVTTVHALPPIDQCANVAELRAPFARPRDEAQRQAVDAIREHIASGRALAYGKSLADAERIARAAAADAVTAGYAPVEADARFLLGMALDLEGKTEDSLAAMLDAAVLANQLRSDLTEANAWIWLVRITGYDLGRPADSEVYARLAAAAIERAGGSDALRADLMRNRGHVQYAKGADDAALPLYQAALALREKVYGVGAIESVSALLDVADVYRNTGRIRESIVLDEDALAKRIASLGEGNLSETTILIALANAYEAIGEFAKAEGAARHALAAAPDRGNLHGYANLYIARAVLAGGHPAEGEAQARVAFEELTGLWGTGSWKLGANRASWAVTLIRRHLAAEAAPEADAGIALLAATNQSADGLRLAHDVRALCLARLHGKGALGEAEAALAAEEKADPEGSYLRMMPAVAVGEAALAAGDAPHAVAVLEKAATIAEGAEPFPEIRADVHLALARALVATRGDAVRAKRLADRAAGEYEATGLTQMATEARRVASE